MEQIPAGKMISQQSKWQVSQSIDGTPGEIGYSQRSHAFFQNGGIPADCLSAIRFFRDQISGVDVLINKLLIERNNSGLTDYALLASIANRLIESKERFVSEYKEMMIDFNYKIQCMELKVDNACALKLINMEG